MQETMRDVKADAARLIETVANGGVVVFPVDVGDARANVASALVEKNVHTREAIVRRATCI